MEAASAIERSNDTLRLIGRINFSYFSLAIKTTAKLTTNKFIRRIHNTIIISSGKTVKLAGVLFVHLLNCGYMECADVCVSVARSI